MAADQFLDEIGNDDEVAIRTYGDKVKEICGFSRGHDAPRAALSSLRAPPFSELNFYDAVVETLLRMPVMQVSTGRKVLLVISSGLDTFSKATYHDALHAAGQSGIPLYAIDLGPDIRSRASLSSNTVPYARLDWPRAEFGLQRIAQASGGRMYGLPPTLDLAGVYDDLMENLRVRYVITYKPTADPDTNGARTVRIELIDSRWNRFVKCRMHCVAFRRYICPTTALGTTPRRGAGYRSPTSAKARKNIRFHNRRAGPQAARKPDQRVSWRGGCQGNSGQPQAAPCRSRSRVVR
jgi:VWFA-related protein